ncbi:MAG: UpxY family transcription antiterminator [Acidobacteriia bacterium]|nr:UpxY family transcription antiterminator [Terriglobia bacterium]
MAPASTAAIVTAESIALPDAMTVPHWYAAYTCAQHEKRVAEQFSQRAVEHFLPLYASVRRWKDRRVRIEMPLFPGYVFVRLALRERLRVLQVPSVVRLVGFGGLPTALPDEQVEILRAGLRGDLRAEPHPFLMVGRRVRVVRGPLAGMEGIVVRKKKQMRLVVSVELIQRSMAVEMDAGDLQAVAG